MIFAFLAQILITRTKRVCPNIHQARPEICHLIVTCCDTRRHIFHISVHCTTVYVCYSVEIKIQHEFDKLSDPESDCGGTILYPQLINIFKVRHTLMWYSAQH